MIWAARKGRETRVFRGQESTPWGRARHPRFEARRQVGDNERPNSIPPPASRGGLPSRNACLRCFPAKAGILPQARSYPMPSRFELANAIRALSMDAVQRAKSGDPGAAMGRAVIAAVLWTVDFKPNPAGRKFPGRDPFVLSNVHGSAVVFSLLDLGGYELSHEGLQSFRQLQ